MDHEDEDYDEELDDDDLDDGSRYGIKGINDPHERVSSPRVSSPHVSKGSPTIRSTSAETIDDNYDAGRYNSARGWEPKDPHKKKRDAYRKRHPEIFCSDSMFEARSANERLRAGAASKRPANLFGDLWRTGELAVLFAESGAGKSILAMQIAESIARGQPMSVPGAVATGTFGSEIRIPQSAIRNREVLYLDFQHSDAQLAERYSCPSPIPGKLPVKYRFAGRHRHITYPREIDIPEAFAGSLTRYFEHSLNFTLQNEAAKVIVIDNLSYLDPRATGAAAAVRRMRSLKLYAAANEVSILVITHAKSRRIGARSGSPPYEGGVAASRGRGGSLRRGGIRPLSLTDIALGQHIAEIADSVFAIGRCTFAPDLRYVKHLKSNYMAPDAGTDVLVFQIERSERLTGAQASRLQAASAVSALIPHSAMLASSSDSSLVTRYSSLPPKPFLGFTYLGTAAESDLIRDYEREYREAEARERTRLRKLRRSSREILVDGILDGSYERYLRG